MAERIVGIIGGSGLYEMEGFAEEERIRVKTSFGDPSDEYIMGRIGGVKAVFLPRHGRGHRLLPSEINARANILGMKKLGVSQIISISAVGSMKEKIAPGHVVIPNQFFDWTRGRPSTFFGRGIAVHVSLADPVCPALSHLLYEAALRVGATVHKGGTYLCIEGPQFSTRGESMIFRSWGVDVIGMTNLPEARLAREAEICYATIALPTDYDCWHETEEAVTVEALIETLHKNVHLAKRILREVIPLVPEERRCVCASALKYAIITDRSAIPRELNEELSPLLGRYLDRG